MTSLHCAVDIDGSPAPLGVLFSTVRRRTLVSSFAYERGYVADARAYPIDPALPLHIGSQPVNGPLPRAFSDAAPDRWGRTLIAKRLRAEASAAGEPTRVVDDRDYLLGVSDSTRQGALRFRTEADGPFEHPSDGVPKLLSLPELLRASESVARNDPDSLPSVKLLLDAGTGSLGGARPKASVRDGDRLLIAKFPHPADEWNVIAWESAALELAGQAGIDVPRSESVSVDGRTVLLLDRFDREGDRRIGYISAMTMVEADDGSPRDYLEIAEALAAQGATTTRDLRQLWRRIAFSVAVNNTDDHLRNHGFLRHRAGWSLSPAFDMNPDPSLAARRVTSIGGAVGPVEEIRALRATAASFDLDTAEARVILREVHDAVRDWRSVARKHGISSAEILRFEPVLDRTGEIVADAASRP